MQSRLILSVVEIVPECSRRIAQNTLRFSGFASLKGQIDRDRPREQGVETKTSAENENFLPPDSNVANGGISAICRQ